MLIHRLVKGFKKLFRGNGFFILLLLIPLVSAESWTGSGAFSSGSVVFYYDDDGIWNLSGGVNATLINASNIVISGSYFGDGSHLTGISADSVADIWVNESGDVMSGNLDMGGNELTSVGYLLVQGLAVVRNVTPETTGLYSLGGPAYHFSSIYVNNVFANSINTSSLSAVSINSASIVSDTLNSGSVASDDVNISENLTLAGYKIKKDGLDLVVVLT